MKKILISVLCLLSVSAKANSPFFPELQDALNAAGVEKTVHAVWDVSANSDLGSSTVNSGVHGLGVYLPTSSLITRSYGWVETAMTDAGTALADATLALKCEDANNIKTGFTSLGANQFIEGASSGASSVMVASIAARCEVTATVTNDNFDHGKVHFYIRYVIPQLP
jgi:hypothetical protein